MRLGPALQGDVADAIRQGVLVGAAAAAFVVPASLNSGLLSELNWQKPGYETVSRPFKATARYAEFGSYSPSPDARHLADWIADSGDNARADFILIDKKSARVLVFDGQARLRANSPVLLGGALGDDTVPGIGSRPLDQVQPQERTTPAGRFVGERGHNARGEDVVWVDYEAAVSIHRVLTIDPTQKRLERLASETVADNRVSWGCINVPVSFFEAYISPIFMRRHALIYVLPEVKQLQSVFASYDVREQYGSRKSNP